MQNKIDSGSLVEYSERGNWYPAYYVGQSQDSAYCVVEVDGILRKIHHICIRKKQPKMKKVWVQVYVVNNMPKNFYSAVVRENLKSLSLGLGLNDVAIGHPQQIEIPDEEE